MFNLVNICFKIDTKYLLQHISLRIIPGEILVVLGQNGAGKSTLLKIVSNQLRPTSGKILLQERQLYQWSIEEQAKIRAVLSQHSNLSFPLSVAEVVLMGRYPHIHIKESEKDYQIVMAALEKTETSHLADRNYLTLSGGEQQRVHLARVLAQIWEPLPNNNSRYLLLDEPTASLDIVHQHQILNIVRDLSRQEQIGGLVILHDLNIAAQYADRIVILKDGQLLAIGKPQEVLSPQFISEAFGIKAQIIEHPFQDCPLVVTNPLF